MMIGTRILQWTNTVEAREFEMLKRGNHIEGYLHDTARRALADEMARTAAVRISSVAPSPDDPWGGMRHTFRYSVGVVEPGDTAAFARQLADARAEGLRKGAAIVAAMGERYAMAGGGCGPVIASTLFEAGRKLEGAATEAAAHYAHPDGTESLADADT